MLTSFGCEQIVQVRATEPTPRARACRAPVEIYSGTRQLGATAKRAEYRRSNACDSDHAEIGTAPLACGEKNIAFPAASRTPSWSAFGDSTATGRRARRFPVC